MKSTIIAAATASAIAAIPALAQDEDAAPHTEVRTVIIDDEFDEVFELTDEDGLSDEQRARLRERVDRALALARKHVDSDELRERIEAARKRAHEHMELALADREHHVLMLHRHGAEASADQLRKTAEQLRKSADRLERRAEDLESRAETAD